MPKYYGRILEFPGYLHTRVFAEVCMAVNAALADLDMLDPEHGTEIVFGANVLPDRPGVKIPSDAILSNLEAHTSGWFTERYLNLLRLHRVLDYDAQQVRWLQDRGVDAKWCPIRYHPCLTRLPTDVPKEVDVLFYGGATGRRIPILQDIEQNSGLTHKWIGHHEDWSLRDHWIPRARIVLNLHSYEGAPLEMVRISYLLANSAFVISEGPQERALAAGMVFADAADMAWQCHYWAGMDEERERIAQMGFAIFSRMTQADALKECLQ